MGKKQSKKAPKEVTPTPEIMRITFEDSFQSITVHLREGDKRLKGQLIFDITCNPELPEEAPKDSLVEHFAQLFMNSLK